jgi:hypothetical protein
MPSGTERFVGGPLFGPPFAFQGTRTRPNRRDAVSRGPIRDPLKRRQRQQERGITPPLSPRPITTRQQW